MRLSYVLLWVKFIDYIIWKCPAGGWYTIGLMGIVTRLLLQIIKVFIVLILFLFALILFGGTKFCFPGFSFPDWDNPTPTIGCFYSS